MITIIGLNHKTAPIAVRERIFTDCSEEKNLLSQLMMIAGVQEAMFISTCNRIEIVACIDGQPQTIRTLSDFLVKKSGFALEELENSLYVHRNENAVRHLFRVASSLDSLVLGEAQILGQMKDAYRQALVANSVGAKLNRLSHRAFRAAKRVRTETAIAANPVSVSYAAVELAKKIFGSLTGKKILLIGAGEMSELAGTHLIGNGAEGIMIANRSSAQAMMLAEKFHGSAVPFAAIPEKLALADIVISSTGAPRYIVSADLIKQTMQQRKNRLLFLIDIAMPRDIDPDAGGIENVYLYNIDNLQDIVDSNMKVRRQEALKAELIVEEEVNKYTDWIKELDAVPTIVSLKTKAQDIVQSELDKAESWLHNLKPAERQKVEALINSIVNKVLHNPVTVLKEESSEFDSANIVALVRRLFQLDN